MAQGTGHIRRFLSETGGESVAAFAMAGQVVVIALQVIDALTSFEAIIDGKFDAAEGGMRTPLLGESNVPDIRKLEEEEMDGPPVLKRYDGAAKFEAGLQGAAGIFGLGEALATIRKAGVDDIAARLRLITDRLIEGLSRIGGEVVSPRRDRQWSGIVSFSPARAQARKIVDKLKDQDVTVVLRKGRVRISPHYYNTDREIDLLLDKIEAATEA